MKERSQRRKAMREMADNNRVIYNKKIQKKAGESLRDYANRNRIVKQLFRLAKFDRLIKYLSGD